MKKQKIHNLDLWKKFNKEKNKKKKEEIKNKLVEIYYPLVQKISFKVAENLSWKVSPEELSSFGVDGLYVAIDRFSPYRGVDFPSYANRRIGGSMIDGIRKQDNIPRSVRIKSNLIEKIKTELETKKGGIVSDMEVIEELGISIKDFLKNKKKYRPISFISLQGSDICSQDKHENFKQDSLENIKDHRAKTPDQSLLKKEFLNKLISKSFSPIEQKIIYMYYYDDLTMGEISEKINISESRVSQIHAEVLPRLKDKIKRNPRFFEENIREYKKSEIGKK